MLLRPWLCLQALVRPGHLGVLWVSGGSWQRAACWIPQAAQPLPGHIFLEVRVAVG